MEFVQQISNEESSNHLEHDLDATDHLFKIKNLLENKSNQEITLRQTVENVQQSKQIVCDKTETLEKIKEGNKILIFQIEYENQWRNRIIKRILETAKIIKTVNSNITLIKNVITHCVNEQTEINRVKEQLLKYTEKENAISNKLIKMTEEENLNMIEFRKEFKIQSTDIDNIIDMKKIVIASLKQKINALKFKNIMEACKTKAVISEVAIISSKCNIVDLNWNMLQQNIETARNNVEMNENIKTLNESCEKNTFCIINLEKKSDKLKNEIKTGNDILREMSVTITELNKKISNYEEKLKSYKTEIINSKEKYKSDKREFERKNQILKLNINKKQQSIVEKEDQNKNFNHEFLEVGNKIESTKSKNNELYITLLCLKDESIKKENDLKEIKSNFENKIKILKSHIVEENSSNNKRELQLFEKQITELKNQYEIQLKNYNSINKTPEQQLNMNSEIDKLIQTKHALEIKLQEIKTKIEEQKQYFEERNKRFERESEIKFANFKEQTRIYMKEVLRVNEMNEEKRNEKLEKIKGINSKTKLQLFGLKTKKLNLSKELDMRIKEINTIQDIEETESKLKRKNENNFKYNSCDCESSEGSIIVATKKLKKLKRKRKTVRKAKNNFKTQKR